MWWFFHLWCASFGWPKTVTTPEIIDQIHKLILEDHRTSAKSIAEQMGISREGVGSIIHEDLDMWKLSAKWVPKCLKVDQKHQWCQSSEQIRNFFSVIQMISCCDWWPWTKPGYITMTRKQSNNQWSGSIAAHPAPKNSECKNLLEKFLPQFFGIKTASSSLVIFQRARLSMQSITHLCWCKWRTFWRKNARGRSPRGSSYCTTMPWLTGHLQPRRNWPTWASSVLITHPILWIWARRTTTCSLDWKNYWKVAIFRLMWRSLLQRRPGWTDNVPKFFLSGLQKLEQWAKKCIELRGEHVEWILSLVAVACFLPGWAKDLSAFPVLLRGTVEDHTQTIHSLCMNWKLTVKEKLLIFLNKSSAVCLEIFSQGVMPADKREVNTSELFYELRQDKLQRKNRL